MVPLVTTESMAISVEFAPPVSVSVISQAAPAGRVSMVTDAGSMSPPTTWKT